MYKVLKIICCATKLNLLLQLSQSMTKRAANIFKLKITIKGKTTYSRDGNKGALSTTHNRSFELKHIG